MMYESTKANMIILMRTIGVAERSQIGRFFRDAPDAKNVAFYLRLLRSNRFLSFENDNTRIVCGKATELKSDVRAARLACFWVIASVGSEKVREIWRIKYPGEFAFATHDGRCFDVSYIPNETIARVGKDRRVLELSSESPDTVTHIAVVPSMEVGRKLEPYGFDRFCILDANHMPQYYEWGSV